MYTKSISPNDVKQSWFVVDAKDLILGRMSSIIAMYLKGKHKPSYTPHVECGDCIIVVNAEKVALTGNKITDKIFYWHTGYPGGIKQRTMGQILSSKHPERVVEKAVERMLPRGPLGRKILKNLKVYSGPSHPHAAQSPSVLDVAAMNTKNTKTI
jgi:large subunit ribosomal protein L13